MDKEDVVQDFPGGLVVKNLPASAGDTGSIPGPGRFHMPWDNGANGPQLLNPRSGAPESHILKPVHLEPAFRSKRSRHNEKTTHCNQKKPMFSDRKPVHRNKEPA